MTNCLCHQHAAFKHEEAMTFQMNQNVLVHMSIASSDITIQFLSKAGL